MILTGDAIDAHRAYEMGLVNHVVSATDLLATALELAVRIERHAPTAVHASLAAVTRGINCPSTKDSLSRPPGSRPPFRPQASGEESTGSSAGEQ